MTSPLGSGLDLDLATILATSMECILYGISLVMCVGAVWALTHGRPRDEANWSMALVAFILTVLSTIHMVIDIIRLVDGFVTKTDDYPTGSAGFFADVTQRTFVIKNVVYVVQTLLGDGIVIYRCYVVWRRFWVVVLPVMLWSAAFVTAAVFLYHILHATNTEEGFLLDFGTRVIPFYLLTMATNILGSGLLAFRIWKTNRDVPGVVRVLPQSGIETTILVRILIDAMVLYALTLVALLICHAFHSTGQLIVLDMLTPIIAITFDMVLVRIAVARNVSVSVPRVMSPLRFSTRIAPSPSEPTLIGARRCSI